MLFNTVILSIIIGTIGGITGGALGLGGSTIMLPLIVLSKIIPDYKTLVGTLLFSILPPISILAVIEYSKRKQINYLVGTLIFIFYTIGAYFGSLINVKYSNKTLIYSASFILFLTSASLLYIGYNE